MTDFNVQDKKNIEMLNKSATQPVLCGSFPAFDHQQSVYTIAVLSTRYYHVIADNIK